ncbi:MAG: 2OG-Fe(II) oxygenase [Alphaproteobacteria bacterium]|nr:2OG-Fe(II) oxygenase [Alphaproteobacteria bacterium]
MSQPQLQTKALPEDAPVLDIAKFKATPLQTDPYDYIMVPGFVVKEAFDPIIQDYPAITKGGSFALGSLTYGPAFSKLVEALESEEFRKAVEEKFSVDLTGKPTIVTVRGYCRRKDGKIHTDTESKIISLLLYMNPSWESQGGRLRLLRSNKIDDVAAEVPPTAGTLLVFRRSDHSWHGHTSHEGMRKVVQLNWVTDKKFVEYNEKRHGWSSFFKRLNPFEKYEG